MAVGAALLRPARTGGIAPRPKAQRPPLMLLTSLPLVFGEKLSLDNGGSPALTALETRYRVIPIAVADAPSLDQRSLLLMAHAAAQPAENLVVLDRWVRSGGRLLLLADPAVEWASERLAGDNLRPSPMFPDTGLLAHWGLRLDAPERRGDVERKLGGRTITARSPGELQGRCAISADRFVAQCRLGRGRAIVVADADFLDTAHLSSSENNLSGLLSTLATLEQK